jgi:glutaconate CoA-transferase subunit B
MSGHDSDTVAFLVRAAREYLRARLVFTGFHWPVLAGEVAARLEPERTIQIFEAGGIARGAAEQLPTSTTDYHALAGSLTWLGSTAVVLPALVRRADLVVLDAANVDLQGQINSTAVGPYANPKVRLAGGGGAADAAYAARELVLLHGGRNPERIVRRVEHVTAAAAHGTKIRLLTRWGTLQLGDDPLLLERVGQTPEHFTMLGINIDGATEAAQPTDAETVAATAVLRAAAGRGYAVAREAVRV